ncbi:MAG TPA: hypothetical protein VHE30_00350, partial [Polyangiaceae bacterium]|nr:hypothetical protein [Polyangiaceae bacterium]
MFVGAAADTEDLRAVLRELLERSGVHPEFESRDRFRSSALLATEPSDARVWVFLQLTGPRRAKLYFRGPLGERFLLRTLNLRRGMDEVGRELVGQVVETSTVALLRSEGGMSREEAKAGLSAEGEEPEPDEAVPARPLEEPGHDSADAGA